MAVMKEKTAYRLKNWAEYNQSLINRGDITLWFSDDALGEWHDVINLTFIY